MAWRWALPLLALTVAACRPAPPAVAARLVLSHSGDYALAPTDFRRAGLGWSSEQLGGLRLFRRGRPLALAVEGDGDARRWRFRADGVEAEENGALTLLLAPADGPAWLRAPVDPPARPSPEPSPELEAEPSPTPLPPAPGAFAAERRFTWREVYLPLRPAGERWLGPRLAAPGSAELDLDLSDAAPGPAQLGLALWAETEAPGDVDHHLELSLDGRPVGEAEWDGAGERRLWFDLPAGLARGPHRLEVSAPGVPGVLAELVLIDALTVRYPAAAAPAPAPPAAIERVEARADLRAEGGGADWLAIGAPGLLEALAPLAEARRAEGLQARRVDSGAVADQFGGGSLDAAALSAFLRHALDTWDPPPRYVLLVGDATEDPAGHLVPPPPARLPTGWFFSQFGGWTASDPSLVLTEPDQAPQAALGRLPARAAGEVRAVVAKTLRLEAAIAAGEAWARSAAAVADPSEPGFAHDADAFLTSLGAPSGGRIGLADGGTGAGLAAALTPHLSDGLGLLAYFGHGSRRQWGAEPLLTTDEAIALGNAGRPGLVLQFTCLTGNFTHPTEPSLAEALLLADGGAAALIAPSSLTLGPDQQPLAEALARALSDPATARLGDALRAARREVPMEGVGARDVLGTFLLFGDPAIRVGVGR